MGEALSDEVATAEQLFLEGDEFLGGVKLDHLDADPALLSHIVFVVAKLDRKAFHETIAPALRG